MVTPRLDGPDRAIARRLPSSAHRHIPLLMAVGAMFPNRPRAAVEAVHESWCDCLWLEGPCNCVAKLVLLPVGGRTAP